MAAWREAKLHHYNHARRPNWKAAKKSIKRLRRSVRRMNNRLNDNARLTV